VLTYQTKSLLLQLLQIRPEEVFIESTGVIGRRIKKVTWVT
jgi:N-acetylglutamate synthase/N-acetylornithine aminotransferase